MDRLTAFPITHMQAILGPDIALRVRGSISSLSQRLMEVLQMEND